MARTKIVAIQAALACAACCVTVLAQSPIVEMRYPYPLEIRSWGRILPSDFDGGVLIQPIKISDEEKLAALAKIHVYCVPKTKDFPVEFRDSEFEQTLSQSFPNSSSDVDIVVDGQPRGDEILDPTAARFEVLAASVVPDVTNAALAFDEDSDSSTELAKIHVYWIPRTSHRVLESRESELFSGPSISQDVEIAVDGAKQGIHNLESRASELWGGDGWAAISVEADVTSLTSKFDEVRCSTTAVVMLNDSGAASGEWFQERFGK